MEKGKFLRTNLTKDWIPFFFFESVCFQGNFFNWTNKNWFEKHVLVIVLLLLFYFIFVAVIIVQMPLEIELPKATLSKIK